MQYPNHYNITWLCASTKSTEIEYGCRSLGTCTIWNHLRYVIIAWIEPWQISWQNPIIAHDKNSEMSRTRPGCIIFPFNPKSRISSYNLSTRGHQYMLHIPCVKNLNAAKNSFKMKTNLVPHHCRTRKLLQRFLLWKHDKLLWTDNVMNDDYTENGWSWKLKLEIHARSCKHEMMAPLCS